MMMMIVAKRFNNFNLTAVQPNRERQSFPPLGEIDGHSDHLAVRGELQPFHLMHEGVPLLRKSFRRYAKEHFELLDAAVLRLDQRDDESRVGGALERRDDLQAGIGGGEPARGVSRQLRRGRRRACVDGLAVRKMMVMMEAVVAV